MSHLQAFLANLAAIPNPFRLPEPYIVPAKGDRAADLEHLAQDFRTVYGRLKTNTSAELERQHVAAISPSRNLT